MTPGGAIDTGHSFTDSAGRDADTHSPTLQAYHRRLWSKRLPDGSMFDLHPLTKSGNYLLRHSSYLGDFILASDQLVNASETLRRKFTRNISPAADARFWRKGLTIGGRTIFPYNRVGGKMTINGARGFHHQIKDRFDLTLESIRRHYARQESPLAPVLARYASFFELFGDFRGYVDFFLLNDLVTDEGAVEFFLPFHDFEGPPMPETSADYRLFLRRQIEFVVARNTRIAHAVRSL
ncbi:MAG: hypothetical protein QM582_16380 [Micropruina sp.]|uniref:DUF6994 family protein n=1 Tax=Micropruina sp. TaxID=2737536 RepID=UPI0039E2705A